MLFGMRLFGSSRQRPSLDGLPARPVSSAVQVGHQAFRLLKIKEGSSGQCRVLVLVGIMPNLETAARASGPVQSAENMDAIQFRLSNWNTPSLDKDAIEWTTGMA